MRKIILIIILLFIAGGVLGYLAVKERMKTDLAFNSRVSNMIEKTDSIRAFAVACIGEIKKIPAQGKKIISSMTHGFPAAEETAPSDRVEIYLKHGSVVKGKLLRKTGNNYTVDWDGREFTVDGAQISRVRYITQKDVEWAYKNDIVINKKNGVVCDGKIIGIDEEALILSLEEGVGGAEMSIPRSEISYLLFAPFYNREVETTENNLKKLFPKMNVYKEGNITLFTDSYVKTVKWYEKIILAAYTEIYLKFFPLFKGRKPHFQNFIVIFDDPVAYVEKTGMPPFIPGFFDPSEKVLYLYNMFGERIEKMLFEMLTSATGTYDKEIERLKKRYEIDKRYDEFIEGKTKEFKDRFWKVYNIYKIDLIDETKSVLRHELAHEIFHNWGLQSIIISRPNVDKEKLMKKKKKFIETTDWNEKKKLLDEMAKIEKPEEIEMAIAGSWLAEGLATYCATEPVGSVDDELLFSYQEAVRKKELNPIEFFTNFEKGSFVGIVPESKYNLYAQSWAFTSFLMDKYQKEFIEYQKKMADRLAKENRQGSAANKDDLSLLLACLNKDLAALEKEFKDYMDSYQKAENPFVKRYIEFYDIWKDLLESHL